MLRILRVWQKKRDPDPISFSYSYICEDTRGLALCGSLSNGLPLSLSFFFSFSFSSLPPSYSTRYKSTHPLILLSNAERGKREGESKHHGVTNDSQILPVNLILLANPNEMLIRALPLRGYAHAFYLSHTRYTTPSLYFPSSSPFFLPFLLPKSLPLLKKEVHTLYFHAKDTALHWKLCAKRGAYTSHLCFFFILFLFFFSIPQRRVSSLS